MKAAYIPLLAAAAQLANCQLPAPVSQDTAWNSTFTLSAAQKQMGQLTDELARQIETIYRWDQTQLANGGTSQDEFYNLHVGSMNAHPTKPGEILKVEDLTDMTPFNLPAEVSMSRIIYTSVNLNGTLVPASGFILWPYAPKHIRSSLNRSTTGRAPSVVWNHGTSGWFADGAPSTHRSLFYGDHMPFALAQAGYAVIAPDYAGLGVNTSWDGTFVPHQYLAREANAKDSLNMIRAARRVFSDRITSDYVIVGHSQGGAVAWGVSEVLAQDSSEFSDLYSDHLGTLMFAPAVDSILTHESLFYPLLSRFMKGIFPTFNPSDWLTPLGIARTQLVSDLQAAQFVIEYAIATVAGILVDNPDSTYYGTAYSALANPGNRPYKGPMLLVQGSADSIVSPNATLDKFDTTCHNFEGNFEYLSVPGAGHFPAMDATRHLWLAWIEDRFSRQPVLPGCQLSQVDSLLAANRYNNFTGYFLDWSGASQWAYHLPDGV